MEDKELILLIEDEPQMRRFLRITLQTQGYRLIESATAQDGLMQATTRNPDVVLLDLGLPDLDGLEVTKRLREWNQTPIIVISAREQEQDKVKALDAGADDYLTKPFNAGELLARIRVALRHVNADHCCGRVDDHVFAHCSEPLRCAAFRFLATRSLSRMNALMFAATAFADAPSFSPEPCSVHPGMKSRAC